MADIFVSYAREDLERVEKLVERLQGEGWSVFWDRETPPGKPWREVLEAELTPAGCVLALGSKSSITSRWVLEEAEAGAERRILLPARLDPVEPPLGFRTVHACDVTRWDGAADSPGLRELIEAIAQILRTRKGVSLIPRALAVVLARPAKHPNLGGTINLTCEIHNALDTAAELRSIEASATGPGDLAYEFALQLVFDVVGATEHIRRIEPKEKMVILADEAFTTGIQLRASTLSNVVVWPAGAYRFQVRGWVNRGRGKPPNLTTTFAATLDRYWARQIVEHAQFSDEAWERKHYSDDAVGFEFILSNIRYGVPAA